MLADPSIADLDGYRSTVREPTDFDEFWRSTLADANRWPLDLEVEEVEPRLATVAAYRMRFAGFGGHPIDAWLTVPNIIQDSAPAILHYPGYGGGRGHVLNALHWSAAGFIHVRIDARGQGTYQYGSTPDPVGTGAPSSMGFMTRGYASPEEHYLRRLITDAVRAVDAVKACEGVDPDRIFVHGMSQGGGLALAVAGLRDDLAGVSAQVPFLCDMRHASLITDQHPYKEIGMFLSTHPHQSERLFSTLAYFDGVNFAPRVTAPTRMSVALMDDICPPSTVVGAFNSLPEARSLTTYEYNGHEGGGLVDDELTIAFFRSLSGDCAATPTSESVEVTR